MAELGDSDEMRNKILYVTGWPLGLTKNITPNTVNHVNGSSEEVKIVPVKFIPHYQARTPQEQGRLEEKFLEFANHATLISRVDYKVYVSEDQDKNIHLCIEKPRYHVMDMNINIDSRGKDGKTASVSVTPIMKHKTYGLEATINDTRYIIPEMTDG